jgi:hypothetical protein
MGTSTRSTADGGIVVRYGVSNTSRAGRTQVEKRRTGRLRPIPVS